VRWTLEGDTLHWSDVNPPDFAPYFGLDGWRRIA
jgi:hypothetical protein